MLVNDKQQLARLQAKDSDRSLALAAASHDPRARRLVVERLFDRVRATVHYLAAGHADADDMVQAALVEVLRSLDGFEGRSRLETWADRITIRCAMRALKRARAGIVSDDDTEPDTLPAPDWDAARGGGEEARLVRRRVKQRLARLLGKLTPERRSAGVLRWVYGYSLAEIADICDAPVNTVRDRLATGKRQLRAMARRDPVLRRWLQESDA